MSHTTRHSNVTLSAEAQAAAEAARRREARRLEAARRWREEQRRRRRVRQALEEAGRVETQVRERLVEIEQAARLWAPGGLSEMTVRPLRQMATRVDERTKQRDALAERAQRQKVAPDEAEELLARFAALAAETETLAFSLRAASRERASEPSQERARQDERAVAAPRRGAEPRARAGQIPSATATAALAPTPTEAATGTQPATKAPTAPDARPARDRATSSSRGAAPNRPAHDSSGRAASLDRASMIAELRDAVLAADRVAGAPSRGEVRQRAIDATAGLERFLAAGDVGAFDRSLDDAQASVGAYVGEAQRAEADHRRRVVEISAGVEQISDEVSALAVECEQLGFRPASLDALLAVSRQLRDALAQGSLDEVARLREEARARFGEVNAALDAWINDRAGADVVITELASVLREVGLRVDPQVLEVMAPGEHGTRVVVARQRDDTALRFAVSSDGTGGHAVT